MWFVSKSRKSLTITVYIGHNNWIFVANGNHPVYVLMVHKTAVNFSIYMLQAHLRVNLLITVVLIVYNSYFYYFYM